MSFSSLKCWISAVAIAVAISTSAAANTARDRSYHFLESAVPLFKKADFRGAIIQLKNALQQDPKNIAARMLLGRSYLRLGDGPRAEEQFWVVRSAGGDPGQVMILLGRSFVLQKKFKRILSEVRDGNWPSDIRGKVLFLRGLAHLEQRQFKKAGAQLKAALNLYPNNGEMLLAMARFRRISGNHVEAEAYIDRALKAAPDNADGWYSKAEFMRRRQDFRGAIEHYSRAIDLAEDHVPARMARATAYIDSGQHNKAQPDVLYVRGKLPNNAQATYLLAMILTLEGKYAKAKEVLKDVALALQGMDPESVFSSPKATLLRGTVNYLIQQFDDAYPYLSRYVSIVPHHAGARKMLGAILLRRNNAVEAVAVLEPAVALAPRDIEILSLLGNAYMRSHDYAKATDIFQKAADLSPDTKSLRTRLAVSRLAVGDSESALSELETASAGDTFIGQADTLLGMVMINTGDVAGALKIANRLAKKEPKNPFPSNLAGQAYMKAGDRARARWAFQQALALDPTYLPAEYKLAELDIQTGQLAKAEKRLRDLLELNPQDTRILVLLAQIAEIQGDVSGAIKGLELVRTIDAKLIAPQIKLMDLYMGVNRQQDALHLSASLEEKNPTNQDVLESKARLEIATGQRSKAVSTLKLAADNAKSSPPRMIRIALDQIRLLDLDGAQSTLQSIIKIDPDFLPAKSAMIRIKAHLGRIDDAIFLADKLRKEHPDSAVGDMLVGDMYFLARRYKKAQAAYKSGQAKDNGPQFAIRLFHARVRQGKSGQALTILRTWNAVNPGHEKVLRILATAYMGHKDALTAIRLHLSLLRQRPKDPFLLKNLALLYQRKGDARAIGMAKRAMELVPTSAEMLDSYGWILVQQGKAAQGLRYLREAASRTSKRPEIRYHIAVALSKLKRFDEARRQLEAVLNDGSEFKDRPAAQALLKDLERN